MSSPSRLRKRSASFKFFNEATLGCRGYTKSPSVCRASARETNVCLTSFSRRTLIVNRRQSVAGACCDDGDIAVSTLWSVIFVSPRSLFRTTAIAEAVTWTLLIGGMFLKYVADAGELGVQIGGFLHGLVFIGYGMTAVLVGVNQRWSRKLTLFAVVTAIIPYATIPFDRWLEGRNLLAGGWRSTASADPRDQTPVSRLLRWMLNRPVLFATIFVVGLVSIMATLLFVGPPGGRS